MAAERISESVTMTSSFSVRSIWTLAPLKSKRVATSRRTWSMALTSSWRSKSLTTSNETLPAILSLPGLPERLRARRSDVDARARRATTGQPRSREIEAGVVELDGQEATLAHALRRWTAACRPRASWPARCDRRPRRARRRTRRRPARRRCRFQCSRMASAPPKRWLERVAPVLGVFGEQVEHERPGRGAREHALKRASTSCPSPGVRSSRHSAFYPSRPGRQQGHEPLGDDVGAPATHGQHDVAGLHPRRQVVGRGLHAAGRCDVVDRSGARRRPPAPRRWRCRCRGHGRPRCRR